MSRDIIRAALEEYTQTPFVSAMGEALNQCCRTLASEGHADDCLGIEALRLFDEQAVPVFQIPDALQMEPYQTIDQGSKNYKAGWNAYRLTVLSLLAGKAIVPIKATPEMIKAALTSAMRDSDEDKYRAIGEIVCIWDAMLAASTTAAQKEGE